MDAFSHLPPLTSLALALLTTPLLPRLVQRLRLPGPIGFLLAGIVLGPHGLGILKEHGSIIGFFSDLGKLLLMFFAGFEIDADEFVRTRSKALRFGIASFALPFVAGAGVAAALGYGANAAALVGSIITSHTLLGRPVVKEVGLMEREAVLVTVGATVITDALAILVLAVCIPIHVSGFSATALATQLVELALYVPAVLIGLSVVGRALMARYGTSKATRTTVLLLLMAIAAQGAELIHLEGIIGAFLAGIAARRATSGSPTEDALEVVSQGRFIPAFFLVAGLLVDFRVLGNAIVHDPLLTAGMLAALVAGKYGAAWFAASTLCYTGDDRRLMFSLSLPQVAATLAVAVAAYQTLDPSGGRLVDEPVLNATIVMVIVSSVVGLVLTGRYAERLQTTR